MTLDEAIKRYTSNAFYEKTDGNLQGYLEFNQLAEWLKELKELKARTDLIPVSERLPIGVSINVTKEDFDRMFEPQESEDIVGQEVNKVLDKIRAEIEQNAYPIVHGVNNHEMGMTLFGILQVIDKYKEEGSENE